MAGYIGWAHKLSRSPAFRSAVQSAAAGVSSFTRGAGRTKTRKTGKSTGATLTAGGTRRGAKSKRRTGGSSTITRTKRRTKDAGNMADYSKVSVQYGKKLSTLMRTMRLVAGNTEKTRWAWRNYNKAFGAQGAMNLYSVQTGLSGTTAYAPLHLYDLTSVVNYNDTTAVSPVVATQLSFSTENSAHTMKLEGLAHNGAATGWVSVDAPAQDPGRLEGGESFLDYVSIKMLLYCATSFPNKFQIDIVSFKDDSFAVAPDTTISTAHTIAFYEYLINQYQYNPIAVQNVSFKKYLKIHKSITVEMDPKETIEASTNRYKEVNLFWRCNRRLNYRWQEDDKINLAAADVQTNKANNQCYVHPKARVFLMIRAFAPFVGPAGVASAANTPTYDIVLTKQHLNLSSNAA